MNVIMLGTTKGHGDMYIGSLFRVDEPVPDDSIAVSLWFLRVRLFVILQDESRIWMHSPDKEAYISQ